MAGKPKKGSGTGLEQTVGLAGWDEVNQCLKRIGELDIMREDLEGTMTLEINQIKERYAGFVEPLVSERREIEALVRAFAESRKDEFVKVRSKELDFGTIAWRVVSSIPLPRAVDKLNAVIRAVKALGWGCIRVKEELDRESLEKLTDPELARIGLNRKVEDKLRIEPKIETVRA